MDFTGVLLGMAVFLIIGLCHPLVIRIEYHMGKRGWWIFLMAGLLLAAASLFVKHVMVSAILGSGAFSCFWGIGEIIAQENRVLKGWFPENPKRHGYYEALRRSRKMNP